MTPAALTELLHILARSMAAEMPGITMKLVRWNDIVDTAMRFYPTCPEDGVRECLQSCCPGDPMFDGKSTLAVSLNANYGWMIPPEQTTGVTPGPDKTCYSTPATAVQVSA